MGSKSSELHPHLHETQIEGSQIYKGKLLDVRRDRVRLPDGQEGTREYIVHQGAVVVIPITDAGKLMLVRQFRYPLGEVFVEFPAGKIDPGEDILTTGQREFLEETGHVANEWRYLGVMHPCVGYSNERIEIFLARDIEHKSEQQLDHGEFVDVLEMELDEAIAAVRAGEITDSKTITGLMWAEKVLRSDW
ncbi:NUDIX domain-containing protein [Propionivibrio soli]|uniref:NUDIX domain-containing protein n=1 Tax=Propionivibrio soli TaxID=2976531 RepID=UPI0021E794B8|nr:NUDIX hydrolase [Propionivibrio soli]